MRTILQRTPRKRKQGRLAWLTLIALTACGSDDDAPATQPVANAGFDAQASTVAVSANESNISFTFLFHEDLDGDSVSGIDFTVHAEGYFASIDTFDVSFSNNAPRQVVVSAQTSNSVRAQYVATFASNADIRNANGDRISLPTEPVLSLDLDRRTASLVDETPSIRIDRHDRQIFQTFAVDQALDEATLEAIDLSAVFEVRRDDSDEDDDDDTDNDPITPTDDQPSAALTWLIDDEADRTYLTITISDVQHDTDYVLEWTDTTPFADTEGHDVAFNSTPITINIEQSNQTTPFFLYGESLSGVIPNTDDAESNAVVWFQFHFDQPLSDARLSGRDVLITEIVSETITTTLNEATPDESTELEVVYTTRYVADDQIVVQLLGEDTDDASDDDASVLEVRYTMLEQTTNAQYIASFHDSESFTITTSIAPDKSETTERFGISTSLVAGDGADFNPLDANSLASLTLEWDNVAATVDADNSGFSVNLITDQITFTFAFDDFLDVTLGNGTEADPGTVDDTYVAIAAGGSAVTPVLVMLAPNMTSIIDQDEIANAPPRRQGAIIAVVDTAALADNVAITANLVAGKQLTDASGHEITLEALDSPLQVTREVTTPTLTDASISTAADGTEAPVVILTFSEAMAPIDESAFEFIRVTNRTDTLTFTMTVTASDEDATETETEEEVVTVNYSEREYTDITIEINASANNETYSITIESPDRDHDDHFLLAFANNVAVTDLAGNRLDTSEDVRTIVASDQTAIDATTTTLFADTDDEREVVEQAVPFGLTISLDNTDAQIAGNAGTTDPHVIRNTDLEPALDRDTDNDLLIVTISFDDAVQSNSLLAENFFVKSSTQSELTPIENADFAFSDLAEQPGVTDQMTITIAAADGETVFYSIGVFATGSYIDAAGHTVTFDDDLVFFSSLYDEQPAAYDAEQNAESVSTA
ncbi:MAG: hypothetical protein K0U36_01745, partial [Alphaproteobacteria bacterium]|nr:hypothetical protein [Alphaproteobacteria bacterium]